MQTKRIYFKTKIEKSIIQGKFILKLPHSS